MIRALAFAAALGIPAPPLAPAHDWFTGQRHPRTQESCCYGDSVPMNMRDCQTLEIDDWQDVGDAYEFVWPKDGRKYRFPKADALPSQDHNGRAAACVLGGRARCFFAPMVF